MIWALLILILLLVVLLGVMAYMDSDEPSHSEPVDSEEAMRASVELHAIRSRLDVAWDKTEQRRGAASLRREIAEALDEDKPR